MKNACILILIQLILTSCANDTSLNDFFNKYPKIKMLEFNWELVYSVGEKTSLVREYRYEENDTTYQLIFSRIYNSEIYLDFLLKQFITNDSINVLNLDKNLDTLYFFKEKNQINYELNQSTIDGKVFIKGKDYFIKKIGLD